MEINSGKLTVSFNLRTERGKELLRDLIRQADMTMRLRSRCRLCGHAAWGEPVEEIVHGTDSVARPDPGSCASAAHRGDLIGGRVRPSVALAQRAGRRLTRAFGGGAVVGTRPTQQRIWDMAGRSPAGEAAPAPTGSSFVVEGSCCSGGADPDGLDFQVGLQALKPQFSPDPAHLVAAEGHRGIDG